jgi:glycosyltransferase involved in cell wall biosynthesis
MAEGTVAEPMVRIGIDARLIAGGGGISSYIRGLLGGLESLSDGDEEYVVFVPSKEKHRISTSFEVVFADVPLFTPWEALHMGRVVGRAGLALLHTPHFSIPWTECRTVTTLFDVIPFHYRLPNPFAAPYIAFMMQRAVIRADHVIAISHAARLDLLEALDCDPGKVTAIHIGIEDAFFDHDGPPAGGDPYFLFVGTGGRHKNIHRLLDALAMARQRDPALRLVLAGGRHDQFRGRDGVIVPGYVSPQELLALYRGALAVVMPSLMEGFGLPPLEGMAMGTPAITSTDAALLEVTGDAALHVDPRSTAGLADAMDRVAHDANLRATLSARGPQRARRFTWRRCAERTRDVYREILSLP